MIEDDLRSIKAELEYLTGIVKQIRCAVISEKNNPSENTEKDAKFDRDNNTGDEPRYCKRCNAKLGSNKDSPSGLCKIMLKKQMYI